MDDHIKAAGKALRERYAALDYNACVQPSCFSLAADQLLVACQMLRDEFDFNYLADITAVDYWPDVEPRFHVVYQLYTYAHNSRLSLRVALTGDAPTISSIERLYPNANWYERELWDMFGIHIDGHSDLRRILMPYDWEGHPLRKDYPLGYEEPQFTFNYDEIDRRKHHARYEEA